jgi:hypothetical protein
MHVVIESTGPVSEARRLLANVVVREALGSLAKQIESVRFRLPQSEVEQRCTLEVQLTTGTKLECHGVGPNMADAFECAAHGMRRKLFAELGLPLPARIDAVSDPRAERRATLSSN